MKDKEKNRLQSVSGDGSSLASSLVAGSSVAFSASGAVESLEKDGFSPITEDFSRKLEMLQEDICSNFSKIEKCCEKFLPPPTNRGVLPTNKGQKVEKNSFSGDLILYDWLSCSSKDEDPFSWVSILGMQDCAWVPMDHGRNGYRNGIFFGNISILYDGNPGMGTCLDMSGQGCRTFESFGSGDFDSLFQLFVSDSSFHMTRLDVAFDDHSGILDIDQLFSDTLNREFVSRFSNFRVEGEIDDGKQRIGKTIYCGSKHSEIMFRIYDKAFERGYLDDTHWVRVEMQLRRDRALAFVCQSEPIGEKFRGVLVNYVRFVDASPDSNRWRWPMKSYWSDLIAGVAAIRLFVKPGVDYNIGQLDNFVFNQASNAIFTALKIYGVPFFIDRINSRSVCDNPKYKRLIDLYGST